MSISNNRKTPVEYSQYKSILGSRFLLFPEWSRGVVRDTDGNQLSQHALEFGLCTSDISLPEQCNLIKKITFASTYLSVNLKAKKVLSTWRCKNNDMGLRFAIGFVLARKPYSNAVVRSVDAIISRHRGQFAGLVASFWGTSRFGLYGPNLEANSNS